MTRYPLLFAAACALPVQAPPSLDAQVAVFDSTTGKYEVEYRSSQYGPLVSAVVEAPNKIDPTLRLLSVESTGGDLVYRYSLMNGTASSEQPIVRFDFDCPAKELLSVQVPVDWEARIGEEGYGPRYVCDLVDLKLDDPSLEPGVLPGRTVGGLAIRTALLPAVGIGYLWGRADGVQWPEGQSVETLDYRVVNAVQEVNGVMGGWVERPVITPMRYPGTLSAPEIMDALGDDLTRVCNESLWISEGLCRSYLSTVTEASASLAQGRTTEARARISDLLRDLEETWRRASGQLESDAYWLLRRNLEAAILRIER